VQKISAQIKLDIAAVVCYNSSMNANNCKTATDVKVVAPITLQLLETFMKIQTKDTSRGHFYVSCAKSVLRIIAAGYLMKGDFFVAGALLGAAEVLGIVEELV
jgi:hypothetical protein